MTGPVYPRPSSDKSHTWFGVYNFEGDPSVVSELVGLEPTSAHAKGDPRGIPERGVRWPSGAWRFEGPLPQTAHVDDQIEALLDVLELRADAAREANTRFDAEIGCAVYYRDFSPGIHLSGSVIQRVSALGLSIDFDLYFLGEADV